jgi:hypothetical protein
MKAPLTLATAVAAIATAAPTSFAAAPAPAGKSDQLDPWAYSVIHRTLPVAGPTDSGFQWGDAGVGAAASTGALLVLLGSSLILLRRRGRLTH